MRTILRLAYDGNYKRCIELLVEQIEKQNTTIKNQSKLIQIQEQHIKRLERKVKITDDLLVQPMLEEQQEEVCLETILKEGTKNT